MQLEVAPCVRDGGLPYPLLLGVYLGAEVFDGAFGVG
jgi:hypothetical protein